MPATGTVTTTIDLYLTADGTRIVQADDPRADRLLCRAGEQIPQAEVERFIAIYGGIPGVDVPGAPAIEGE